MAEKMLKITLIKSPIGAIPKHRKTIETMGLRKLHKTIECAVCRNLRIGRELDLLDEHYSVPEQSVYD